MVRSETMRLCLEALADTSRWTRSRRCSRCCAPPTLTGSPAIEDVAQSFKLPVEAVTLSELARSAPEPLRSIVADHREGFATLTSEIEDCTATDRRLATSALSSLQDASTGSTGRPSPPPRTRPTAATKSLLPQRSVSIE